MLIAAAYVHDIGYAPELVQTGFHPIDGARWLRDQGHPQLACLVAHHSGARFEASARGLADAIAAFPEEASAVADALTYCDLTTGPEGATISVATRLGDIEQRYGASSPVTQALEAAGPTLNGAVARTAARLTQLRSTV